MPLSSSPLGTSTSTLPSPLDCRLDLSIAMSRALKARVVLLLVGHIGSQEALTQTLGLARESA